MVERDGDGWADSDFASAGANGTKNPPGLFVRRVHTCPFCGAEVGNGEGKTKLATHLPKCEGKPR